MCISNQCMDAITALSLSREAFILPSLKNQDENIPMLGEGRFSRLMEEYTPLGMKKQTW